MDVGYYLGAGTYGGYFMKSYGGAQGPDTYTFTAGVLNEIMFNDGYNNLMAPLIMSHVVAQEFLLRPFGRLP